MRIVRLLPVPGFEFLNPTLQFETTIEYKGRDEIIVNISGWLEAKNNVKVSYISEYLVSDSRENKLSARGSWADKNIRDENYQTRLVTELNDKALTFIENNRMQDKKGDVNLRVTLNITYISSNANVAHVYRLKPSEIGIPIQQIQTSSGRTKDFEILCEAYDSEYNTEKNNGWFLSGAGGPEFLNVMYQKITYDFRIPSTDWIYEYASKFGLGEYYIIQIPKGDNVLVEAWNYVDQAESSYRNWNTKGVYANCRECGNLLDNKIKEKFGKNNFTYKERWGRVYSRFEKLASLNLHLEDLKLSYPSEEVEIYKPDAENLLINALWI